MNDDGFRDSTNGDEQGVPGLSDRVPARCLTCWYIVEGLSASACPECGRAFSLSDPTSFTRNPPFVLWRFWLPGLLLAIVCGTVVSLLLLMYAPIAVGLTFATPTMIGVLAGYGRGISFSLKILVGIAAGTGVLACLLWLNVMGLLCALMAFVVGFVPIIAGAVFGLLLRKGLKDTHFSQRAWLPLVVVAPLIVGAVERAVGYPELIEIATTQRVLELRRSEAWRRLAFYEECPGTPPFPLSVAGPKPVRTVVVAGTNGRRRICYFRKGFLTKEVREVRPPTRFAFDVTEQQIGEERSVRVLDGCFDLTAVSAEQTRATLTTRYVAKLRPRWVWRPLERWVCRAVHTHVLDAMEAGPPLDRAPYAPEAPAP